MRAVRGGLVPGAGRHGQESRLCHAPCTAEEEIMPLWGTGSLQAACGPMLLLALIKGLMPRSYFYLSLFSLPMDLAKPSGFIQSSWVIHTAKEEQASRMKWSYSVIIITELGRQGERWSSEEARLLGSLQEKVNTQQT